MTNENISKLKLLAEDVQDLNVFSAYLQDSVIVANDIKFLPKTKKLICVFNRFMWEDAEKGIFRKNKRIRSALVFDNVSKVKSKGISPKKKTKILEFLAIKTEIKDNYMRSLKEILLNISVKFFCHIDTNILFALNLIGAPKVNINIKFKKSRPLFYK